MDQKDKTRFKELLEKYLTQQISPEDEKDLLHLIDAQKHDDELMRHIEQTWNATENIESDLGTHQKRKILAAILK